MQHHLHLMIREHLAHLPRIGDRAEHRHDVDMPALGQLHQFLMHRVERQFGEFIKHDLDGLAGQHLPAEFRADRTTRAGNQHHPPLIAGDRVAQRHIRRFATQEILRRHRGQLVDKGLFADQLGKGRQGLHLEPHLLQPPGDLGLFRLAERGHGQQHPVDVAVLDQLGDLGWRKHRQAKQRHALKRGIVIDKGDRVDAVMVPERLR